MSFEMLSNPFCVSLRKNMLPNKLSFREGETQASSQKKMASALIHEYFKSSGLYCAVYEVETGPFEDSMLIT